MAQSVRVGGGDAGREEEGVEHVEDDGTGRRSFGGSRGPRSRRERDSGAAIKGEAKPYVERSRMPAWPEHWYEPRRVWVGWTRVTPQGVQQVDMKRWLCGRRIGEAFETEATAEGHTGRRGEGAQEVVVCGWNPERAPFRTT